MNVSLWLGRIGRSLGYSLFFFVMCAVFLVLTFPTEQTADYLSVKGSEALGGDLEIGELDIGITGDLDLNDVTVRFPPDGSLTKSGKPAPGPLLAVDSLELDVGLLSLLGENPSVTFDAQIQGGEINGGSVVAGPEGAAKVVIEEMSGIQIGSARIVKRAAGYDLRGILGGTVDVDWKGSAETLVASVDLGLSQTRIVKPIVPTKQLGPIELGDIDVGEFRFLVEVGLQSELTSAKGKRGKRKRGKDHTVILFKEVGASGDDIDIAVDPSSTIRIIPKVPFKNARLDLHFAVQFKDRFFDKKVKGADGSTSQPNRILRMVLKQDARMRSATRDGVLGVGCRGTVGKPDCRPEQPRVRGFKKHKPRFKASASEDEDEQDKAQKPSARKNLPKPKPSAKDRAAERRRAAQDRRAAPRSSAPARGSANNSGSSNFERSPPNRGSPPPSALRPSSATLARPIPTPNPSSVTREMQPMVPNDSAYGGGDEEDEEENEEEDEEEDDEDEDEDDEDDEDDDEDEDDEDDDEDEEEDDE
ncbi:MAG: type II secretion system protein GspN [Deltaproteobacteria bacterium]|nr:type II secretion system protein GspN [Deltaproteobacteria bacterium]